MTHPSSIERLTTHDRKKERDLLSSLSLSLSILISHSNSIPFLKSIQGKDEDEDEKKDDEIDASGFFTIIVVTSYINIFFVGRRE